MDLQGHGPCGSVAIHNVGHPPPPPSSPLACPKLVRREPCLVVHRGWWRRDEEDGAICRVVVTLGDRSGDWCRAVRLVSLRDGVALETCAWVHYPPWWFRNPSRVWRGYLTRQAQDQDQPDGGGHESGEVLAPHGIHNFDDLLKSFLILSLLFSSSFLSYNFHLVFFV